MTDQKDRTFPPIPPEEAPPLSDEVARFAKSMCTGIRSRRARLSAEEELIDHIHNAIYEESLRGVSPEASFPVICASFGDPAILRQQLAGVHNRLPPDFGKTMGRFALRLLAAIWITQFLRGMWLNNGYAFGWHTELPGVLILFGLRPFHAIRRAWHRLCFHGQIRRICRCEDRGLLQCPSLSRVLFGRSATGQYVMRTGETVTVIRHISVSPRGALRFVDETSILHIRQRSGVGLADRRPGQFNWTKTAALGYVTLRPASFSYLLPQELSANQSDLRLEKLLIIDSFPRELTVIEGNAVREAVPGDCVFDFRVHTRKTCIAYIQSSIVK